jgi:hypothetical protein
MQIYKMKVISLTSSILILSVVLSFFIFPASAADLYSSENHELMTYGPTHETVSAQSSVSGVTTGQLMYTSSLKSRIISDDPTVPLEVVYVVDVSSADPRQPVSAIVSTLFTAKRVGGFPYTSNNTISNATEYLSFEDSTRISGLIERIMKEFVYTS